MSIEHEIGRMVKKVVRNEMGDMRHRISALEARMAGPVGPPQHDGFSATGVFVPVGVGGVGTSTPTPEQGVFHGITTTGSIGTSTPKPEPSGLMEAVEEAYSEGVKVETESIAIQHQAGLRAVIEAVAEWLDDTEGAMSGSDFYTKKSKGFRNGYNWVLDALRAQVKP